MIDKKTIYVHQVQNLIISTILNQKNPYTKQDIYKQVQKKLSNQFLAQLDVSKMVEETIVTLLRSHYIRRHFLWINHYVTN